MSVEEVNLIVLDLLVEPKLPEELRSGRSWLTWSGLANQQQIGLLIVQLLQLLGNLGDQLTSGCIPVRAAILLKILDKTAGLQNTKDFCLAKLPSELAESGLLLYLINELGGVEKVAEPHNLELVE